MSDFLNNLSALFTFLFTQLGNVANFFITNTLGIIILGVALFYLIFSIITLIIAKIKD